MKKVIFILVYLFIINCTYSQTNERSLVRWGDPIDITEVPWQVLLKQGGSARCGATILNDRWVITAAHCVTQENSTTQLPKEDFLVHFGINDKNQAGTTRMIKQIIIYPDYDGHAGNDVALIELLQPIMFTQTIQPIDFANCEDDDNQTFQINSTATLTGWGHDGLGYPDLLKSGDVSIDIIGTSEIIINSAPNEPINCLGDSGGPLFAWDNNRPVLIGITSSRIGGSCITGTTAFFEKVSFYSPFIEQYIYNDTNTQISGPNLVCFSNTTFHLNPNFCSNVTWIKSSNLAYVTGQNSNSYTVKAVNPGINGSGWIQAIISGEHGNITLTKTIWVGRPPSIGGTIIGPSVVYTDDVAIFTHTEGSSSGTYNWSIPFNGPSNFPSLCQSGCWRIISGSTSAQLTTAVGSTNGYVQVRKKNTCGYGGAIVKWVTIGPGSGGGGPCNSCPIANVFPSNTSSELNIRYEKKEIQKTLDLNLKDNQEFNALNESFLSNDFAEDRTYRIHDFSGKVVYSSKSKSNNLKIDVSRFKEKGIYVLTIGHGSLGSKTYKFVSE